MDYILLLDALAFGFACFSFGFCLAYKMYRP
jgi:hypothetical protein